MQISTSDHFLKQIQRVLHLQQMHLTKPFFAVNSVVTAGLNLS